jgi:tRNA pseudouridine65 synthase
MVLFVPPRLWRALALVLLLAAPAASLSAASGGPSLGTAAPPPSTTNQAWRLPRVAVVRYEDRWVAVNKPAGISVHRSTETRHGDVVLTKLLRRQFRRKVWPVHRLDHRTSGCLLFAFDSAMCAQLQKRLSSAEKTYVALVRGEWRQPSPLTCDDAIMVEGVAKSAETTFEVLATQREPRCTLLAARPRTGRTHQIRKHAFYVGHPILGDTAHGCTRTNREWRERGDHGTGLNRLALHCLRIELPASEKGANDAVTLEAPLPEDTFRATLRAETNLWREAQLLEPALDLPQVDHRGGSRPPWRGAAAQQGEEEAKKTPNDDDAD